MNERVCATALYYIDSGNITPSNVQFRMQTPTHVGNSFLPLSNYVRTWLERTHGTSLINAMAQCLQTYGTVNMRNNRLLAFPNVL
jgi:hypothetical protein